MHFNPPLPFDPLNQNDYEPWYDVIDSIVNFVTASTQLASTLRNSHNSFCETLEIREVKGNYGVFDLSDFPWFLLKLQQEDEIEIIDEPIPFEYRIREIAPLIQFPQCNIMQGEPNTQPRTFTLIDTWDFGDVDVKQTRCPSGSLIAPLVKKISSPKPEESNQSFFREFSDSEQTIDSSNFQDKFENLDPDDGKSKLNIINESRTPVENLEQVLAVYEPPPTEGELYLECNVEEFIIAKDKKRVKIDIKEEGVYVDNDVDFPIINDEKVAKSNQIDKKPKIKKPHENTTEKCDLTSSDKIAKNQKLSNKDTKINSNKKNQSAKNKNLVENNETNYLLKPDDKKTLQQQAKKQVNKNPKIVKTDLSKEQVDYVKRNITNCPKPKIKAKRDLGKEKSKASSRQNTQNQPCFSADAVEILHLQINQNNKFPSTPMSKARSVSPPSQKLSANIQPEPKSCLKLATKRTTGCIKKCVINEEPAKNPATPSVITRPPLVRNTTLKLTAAKTLRKATELLKSAEDGLRPMTAVKMQVVSGSICPGSAKSSKR